MPTNTRPSVVKQPVRKPLYGSIWLAFFALLWEHLVLARVRSQS